jgi:hypothetical protein
MKGQRIRYQQTGEFHFITFSSFRRQPYLSTVAAMELFEDALERVRQRYLFTVAGYVVMPEAGGPGPGMSSSTKAGCPRCLAFGHLGVHEPQSGFR